MTVEKLLFWWITNSRCFNFLSTKSTKPVTNIDRLQKGPVFFCQLLFSLFGCLLMFSTESSLSSDTMLFILHLHLSESMKMVWSIPDKPCIHNADILYSSAKWGLHLLLTQRQLCNQIRVILLFILKNMPYDATDAQRLFAVFCSTLILSDSCRLQHMGWRGCAC